MRVHTAVVPAAGMGTRFLPATKAVPKELLPIIDTPALQLIIDEAVGAGVDHMVIVTSHAKPAIEAYFQPQPEVIAKLRSSGRDEMADRLESIGRDVKVSFAYQDQALGLGHAVGCAREAVGDEPFAVLLPDELMGDSSLLDQMARLCESTNGSVVGLKEVPHEQVGSYGVIDPIGELDADGVIAIRSMVEKPKPADAPSDLIIIGRYVLTPDVFDEIAQVQPGAGGEIQLTDALKAQAARSPFHGVVKDVLRYDTGNPFGWLSAVIEIGLKDPKIGPQLREWLPTQL
ncbi:MAG: UTP--glucose-1-phosphate uridylyltransferase [Actinobacteria bacterium]|nr:UTP--glucose-1-phosphate uridylyltransferase [Actinomycetota bacterium]